MPASNRDPLAEFSEHLVAALLDATVATSRVQAGWDLTDQAGRTVQVRYLANPSERWINEHVVDFRGGADRYALVVFEDLDPRAVIVFEREQLAGVGDALGKRHRDLDVTLQLTQANYRRLRAAPAEFEPHGVTVIDLIPTE